MASSPRAVVLLSGGLDSYTAGAMAARDGYELYALTVRYGQVHAREVEAARRVAAALRVERHIELDVDLAAFGGSALVGDGDIPKDRDVAAAHDIPATYVPARNTVFLSLALAWAEVVGATAIVIGVNALDYSGYPDCRPEYLEAFERLAALATKAGVEGARLRIVAPLLRLSKAEIIAAGVELGLDYGLTHSCYDPRADGTPCGRCDSCLLRAKGFLEAGMTDPVLPLVTERLYYTDPYLTEFDARVVDVRDVAGRTGVVLDRTAFYPTSGGQPFDTGTIGGARVVDVVDGDDGAIVHVVEGEAADSGLPPSRQALRRAGGARTRFGSRGLGAALRSHAAAHRPARAVGGHRSRLRRAHRELPSWRRHGDDRPGARADHGGDRGLGRRRQRGGLGRSAGHHQVRRRGGGGRR